MKKSMPAGPAMLLAQIRAERLAGDPSHHLADQESLRVHVIAVTGARLPPRLLGGERLGHDLPLAPRSRGSGAGDGRKPRLMRQEDSAPEAAPLPAWANSGQ